MCSPPGKRDHAVGGVPDAGPGAFGPHLVNGLLEGGQLRRNPVQVGGTVPRHVGGDAFQSKSLHADQAAADRGDIARGDADFLSEESGPPWGRVEITIAAKRKVTESIISPTSMPYW